LAEASTAAAAAPAEASFLDSMIASAKSAVSIRRIGADTTGNKSSAVLARAGAALEQGDLITAIKEIEAMPVRDGFAGWLDEAHARASAHDTLTKLQSTVLTSLGGSHSDDAKP